MRRSNTAIAEKETKAKLTGKAFVNFWDYSAIINRIKDVAEEYGIKVKPMNKANTSKTCFLCGEIHENGRIKRGLFECPHTENPINAFAMTQPIIWKPSPVDDNITADSGLLIASIFYCEDFNNTVNVCKPHRKLAGMS